MSVDHRCWLCLSLNYSDVGKMFVAALFLGDASPHVYVRGATCHVHRLCSEIFFWFLFVVVTAYVSEYA